jgi:hypothetical protein
MRQGRPHYASRSTVRDVALSLIHSFGAALTRAHRVTPSKTSKFCCYIRHRVTRAPSAGAAFSAFLIPAADVRTPDFYPIVAFAAISPLSITFCFMPITSAIGGGKRQQAACPTRRPRRRQGGSTLHCGAENYTTYPPGAGGYPGTGGPPAFAQPGRERRKIPPAQATESLNNFPQTLIMRGSTSTGLGPAARSRRRSTENKHVQQLLVHL